MQALVVGCSPPCVIALTFRDSGAGDVLHFDGVHVQWLLLLLLYFRCYVFVLSLLLYIGVDATVFVCCRRFHEVFLRSSFAYCGSFIMWASWAEIIFHVS
jgi:hypothetical protein